MRNGVLGVIGETVAGALSSPSLDEQSRMTRDKLLDRLEQHLHDVNAFVRSRCLQIWLQLANAKVSITTDNTSRMRQKAPFGKSIRALRNYRIFFCQFKPYKHQTFSGLREKFILEHDFIYVCMCTRLSCVLYV